MYCWYWLGTSSSAKIALTGHSGSHAPQSMHSSGWMSYWSSVLYMHWTGQTATQLASLTLMHGSVITYVMRSFSVSSVSPWCVTQNRRGGADDVPLPPFVVPLSE